MPLEHSAGITHCKGNSLSLSSEFSWKHKPCRGCCYLWIYVGTESTAWEQNDGRAAPRAADSCSLVFITLLVKSVPHKQLSALASSLLPCNNQPPFKPRRKLEWGQSLLQQTKLLFMKNMKQFGLCTAGSKKVIAASKKEQSEMNWD